MREHPLIREVSEWRRLRAVALHEQGWPEVLIAEALDVNKGTVSRWLAVAKTGGVEALLGHTGAGHPPKLTPE
jgi:transposase